ncbi:hypothetical protein JW998_05250 [candidate division KSB1 bacterium]|nr:hypothetical protein [candidate division KSB1 bacterium]
MAIQRFRSFQDAEEALWVMKPDREYYQRVAEHWDFVRMLRPADIPKGIFKFKTIQEANQHREKVDFEIAKKIYDERIKTKKLFIKNSI